MCVVRDQPYFPSMCMVCRKLECVIRLSIEEMNLKEIIEIQNLLFYLVFSLKSPKGLENIFCKAKS